MNKYSEKSRSRLSNSIFYSPTIVTKVKARESKLQQHNGSNFEQKLQILRMLILGYDNNNTTQVPVVEPLKPMPYVRCFDVSDSHKKSRSLRFFCFCFYFKLKYFNRFYLIIVIGIRIQNNG
jgi:hypothetical protein